MVASPNLDDLIWLFEGDPEPKYPDERVEGGGIIDWRKYWPYTTVTFRLDRATFAIRFTISPGYEHVRLVVEQDGLEIVDLDLRRIRDVSVERADGRELLRLDSRDDGIGALYVQTKPTFALSWSVGKDF